MNMNLKLDLDYKKLLPMLRQAQPYVFGVLLVGVFAYTALTVNAALNIKADGSVAPAITPAAKVTFDKPTIDAVKKLDVVQGTVDPGSLGTSNPFQ
jgi:hypothetical protein